MNGSAFIFGDDIDTDVIAPGGVLHRGMQEIVKHSMEALVPNFYQTVNQGDIIIAGSNFGCGSSREQAPMVLKEMGIDLVLARSFSRLFFRNAVNVGLNIGILDESIPVSNGGDVEYFLDKNTVRSTCNGPEFHYQGPEGILQEIISDGGLVQYVRKQLKK